MIGRRAGSLLLCVAGGLAATPAFAQAWIASGAATLRAGVESNPYLGVGSGSSTTTGTAGLTVTGNATRSAPTSTTSILGSADVTQYFSRYGRNSNFLIGASRSQQFTEHLQLNGNVNYSNTLNPQNNFGFDPTQETNATIDYLTVGNRSQRIDGNLNVDFQPWEKDTFRVGGFASHAKYNGVLDSSYNQYGGTFSYLRTLNARTRVGVQLTASTVDQSNAPSSQTYGASLQLIRQISAHWNFDGSIGANRIRSRGPFSSSGTSLAFSANLCGQYTRTSICFAALRTAAPSGIGGLRTDTQLRINGGYDLTEHSRVTVGATADQSSGGNATLIPRQRYYDLTVGYSHQVARRLSVGATGRLQRRETSGTSLFRGLDGNGYALNGTVTYSFGQTGL